MEASLLPHIRAVLFDLDGTLLDTLEDLANSTNRILAKEGFFLHNIPSYKQFVGEGITMLVRRAVPPDLSDHGALISRLVAELSEDYSRHCLDATRAYPGIGELLAGLEERGIPMAVLSNKPDAMVKMLVKHYFPQVAFAAVAGASKERPRKPDPTWARAIAQRLGIPPEQCIFLGDSKTDMQTATAAGMYPIGALWGFRDAQELLAYGAKKLLKSPEELLAVVKAND